TFGAGWPSPPPAPSCCPERPRGPFTELDEPQPNAPAQPMPRKIVRYLSQVVMEPPLKRKPRAARRLIQQSVQWSTPHEPGKKRPPSFESGQCCKRLPSASVCRTTAPSRKWSPRSLLTRHHLLSSRRTHRSFQLSLGCATEMNLPSGLPAQEMAS